MKRFLTVASETWPIAGQFTISRGAKTEAAVVVAKVSDGTTAGTGEAVPYARYGESVESVIRQIAGIGAAIETGTDRRSLLDQLPAGAARCALDCALWDLEAKQSSRSAADIAGLSPLKPVETAFTLSLDSPEAMARSAADHRTRPLLKVKLGAEGDSERIAAIRRAAPSVGLIVDANEGWTDANLAENLAACAAADVAMIEQPLPAESDSSLASVPHPIPICADESLHPGESPEALVGRYDAVNIKLDKAGGLTAALALQAEARELGLKVMVGCMVGTSLSMAPALLLAQSADYVDLDGPLHLLCDRPSGLVYDGSVINPPDGDLWG